MNKAFSFRKKKRKNKKGQNTKKKICDSSNKVRGGARARAGNAAAL
jgi:hypothetical protein